jgi:hypothetical protein
MPSSPSRLSPRARWRPIALVALFVAGGLVAACGSAAPASFDPASACNGASRQQMKGAYAALEARIPTLIDGKAATRRDSGRFCARETLGSLYDAGVNEEHFGGGIWDLGGGGGVQLGAFTATGLTPALVAEEYRRGAQASRSTQGVKSTTLQVDGRPAWRIDLATDSSRQAIVVWGSADGSAVQVVVAADVDETVLQDALAAYR